MGLHTGKKPYIDKMIPVTIITPTTQSRDIYLPSLLQCVANQKYKGRIEHLFNYDNCTIGAKRNKLIEQACGDIIIHMDSDDWYSPYWVSKSVEFLLNTGADIVGLSSPIFKNDIGKKYQYIHPHGEQPFIAGATMCYKKNFAMQHKFMDISKGEDFHYTIGKHAISHNYTGDFIASIHSNNTCKKQVNGERWVKL